MTRGKTVSKPDKPLPPLTKRQGEILLYMVRYWRDNLYWPSMREIASEIGATSTNGVKNHTMALVKKGYLVEAGGKMPRSYTVPGLADRLRDDLTRHVSEYAASLDYHDEKPAKRKPRGKKR